MKILLIAAAMMAGFICSAQNVQVQEDKDGRTTAIKIAGDSSSMNWILRTDGSQYPWVTETYRWGNGRLKVNGEEYYWDLHKGKAQCGDLSISMKRTKARGGDIREVYTFRNKGSRVLKLSEIGIFTPFNDNYPDADTCATARCNAHIWAGGETAYVCAMRMSGAGPHLGLMLTEGSIDNYELFERAPEKGMSNFRGVIALCPPFTRLRPGESYKVEWRLFSHDGKDDFEEKMIERGGAVVTASRYVADYGRSVNISIRTSEGTSSESGMLGAMGNNKLTVKLPDGRRTVVETYAIPGVDSLLARRARFIVRNQQLLDSSDVRYGAYMVYDNVGDTIVTDYTRSDLSEGRERVGMGVFLAEYCRRNPDTEIMESLLKYAGFVQKLQDDDFNTGSSLVLKRSNRGYNYAWVSDFWFRMYELTGNRDYARRGYGTLRALYRQFGSGFYCIDYPVIRGLRVLSSAGMDAQRDTLLTLFRQTGDTFVANGLSMPKFEVNYEQSIVAPAVQFLSELYIATRDEKYLEGARVLMPALEAFSFRQPSCYLNEIGIRHWDGWWFGKRQTYGDTFPHYWSTITAGAFHYYAQATGERGYQKRAETIVMNNLVSYSSNGRATCAILRPVRVNGIPAAYRDAYANDQDWALVFYLTVYE